MFSPASRSAEFSFSAQSFCASGDCFGIVFGEADPPSKGGTRCREPIAKQWHFSCRDKSAQYNGNT